MLVPLDLWRFWDPVLFTILPKHMLIATGYAGQMKLPLAVREIKASHVSKVLPLPSLELQIPQGTTIENDADGQHPHLTLRILLLQWRVPRLWKLDMSRKPIFGSTPTCPLVHDHIAISLDQWVKSLLGLDGLWLATRSVLVLLLLQLLPG